VRGTNALASGSVWIVSTNLCTSPNFLQWFAAQCIKHPQDRALFRGRDQPRAVEIQGHARQVGCVRLDLVRPPLLEDLNPNVSLVAARARQHRLVACGGEGAQTLGVRDGVDLVRAHKVRELVDQDLVLEHDDDLVSPEPHCAYLMPEGQLPYIFFPLIVPYNHLVRWEAPIVRCPYESKDVAAEQHFYEADSPPVEHAIECFLQRRAVVHAKPSPATDGEAALVLVEAHVLDVILAHAAQVDAARPHLDADFQAERC
jgi:hypothetical protein